MDQRARQNRIIPAHAGLEQEEMGHNTQLVKWYLEVLLILFIYGTILIFLEVFREHPLVRLLPGQQTIKLVMDVQHRVPAIKRPMYFC